MSVAICRSSAVQINAPLAAMPIDNWLVPGMQQNKTGDASVVIGNKDGEPIGQSDIWSMIQSQKGSGAQTAPPPPYIHPFMRRSQSLMSQKSLEMCTENLGSETGSDPFNSEDDRGWFSPLNSDEEDEIIKEKTEQHKVAKAGNVRRELDSVNYHCSISRRSPPRSFPPPLPSISRRDGPCIQMRTHRRDGRLVVEAVPVKSQNYLHARRQDGRLILSFIDTAFQKSGTYVVDSSEIPQQPQELEQEEQLEEHEVEEQIEAEESQEVNDYYDGDDEDAEGEEEEDEVEVVDRGTVVEVKVSTQPQQQNGSVKVLRSSLVINKFVGGAPLSNQNRWAEPPPTTHLTEQEYNYPSHPQRRTTSSPTTAAAAAVAASSASASSEVIGHRPAPADSKLLFTSKRRNREELLHDMRRCSELRQPLFFWEPCCIATSS